jgi:hypothetical protein
MLALENEPQHWRIHFFYGLNDPIESCSLQWNLDVTTETRPPGTLPIASDEGGSMFYLRWDSPDAGSVHFGPTPWGGRKVRLMRICDSFTEFLERLHEIKA